MSSSVSGHRRTIVPLPLSTRTMPHPRRAEFTGLHCSAPSNRLGVSHANNHASAYSGQRVAAPLPSVIGFDHAWIARGCVWPFTHTTDRDRNLRPLSRVADIVVRCSIDTWVLSSVQVVKDSKMLRELADEKRREFEAIGWVKDLLDPARRDSRDEPGESS
jgi:hypothetical protein